MLNDKAAKSKLLKGAKREAMEVQTNSTSTTLIFSAGSWQAAVLPSMAYWNQVKGDQTCKVGDVMINVGGIKSGKDVSGKNIVNQVVFLVDRDKVVCHLYNTTQRILVNGHGYQRFVEIFLKPYLQAKIDVSSHEIIVFNNKVLEEFGPRTVKRSDVKYRGGSLFTCNVHRKAGQLLKTIQHSNIH